MRWAEAHQGVRMIKFRSVLDRFEPSTLNQVDAVELLGISERTLRHWCNRYDDSSEAAERLLLRCPGAA